MYTVSIVADQQVNRSQFACFLAAVDYVKAQTGYELCAMRAYGEVINGRGVMMHVAGCFIAVARYN